MRKRRSVDLQRSDLRLTDLHVDDPSDAKLMNTKVPDAVRAGIDRVSKETGSTKTAVVIALLNEGLDAFAKRRNEFPSTPPRTPRRRRGPRPQQRP